MSKVKPIEVDDAFIDLMEVYRRPDKTVGMIEACSKNPVVFAELMLGVRLYAWQVYVIQDMLRYMESKSGIEYAIMTSRQIGKSTLLAILGLWCTIFNKYPGTMNKNTIMGITSATDDQAKKLLRDIKTLLRRGDVFMETQHKDKEGNSMFGKEFFTKLLSTEDPNNTTTITFKPYRLEYNLLLKDSLAGSSIRSYPPTDKVLGETFCIVAIDEAGKSDKIDDQFYYDYIYPTGNSTNAIRMAFSTPWFTSGFFYRLVDPDGSFGQSDTRVFVFTIDAIRLENPHYYTTVMKTIEQMKSDGKLDEVQRAYYCRFVKGEQSYFDSRKVRPAFTEELQMQEGFKGSCDMGVDFGGQVTSRTVITISTLDSQNIVRRLYHRVYPVGQDLTLVDDIKELMKRFKVERIIPDECPAGDFLIRKMKEMGLPIYPMNFRQEKVKKYGAFRSKLNKEGILSYIDEPLKVEMLAMEFNNGSRQSIIQHAPGYTDDLIDSFVMSSYFYLDNDEGVKFYAPTKKEPRFPFPKTNVQDSSLRDYQRLRNTAQF